MISREKGIDNTVFDRDLISGGGQRQEPGRKGAGGVRERREQETGSGILKMMGSGRN